MASVAAVVVVAAVVAAVGAGVSAYGQYQSGQQQKAIAEFNASQQERQAKMAALTMQTQSELQKQQAEQNFQLRTAEANARLNNARQIEEQALGQDRVNRDNLVKRRQEFERMQGTQRAAIAASGLVESSGTPLDLLAETASKIQQDQDEQHYANELQRRTLFSEAAMEKLGGKLALAGATLNRDSALAEAALRAAAGKGEYLAGLRQAQITRLTGGAAADAATYQAGGTLLSGVGQAAGGGVQRYHSIS